MSREYSGYPGIFQENQAALLANFLESFCTLTLQLESIFRSLNKTNTANRQHIDYCLMLVEALGHGGRMEWFLIKRSCRQKCQRGHERMLHRKLTLLYHLLREAALEKLANLK